MAQIRTALGSHAVSIEHIGSTSVPTLAAKPLVDILVTVADITAEEDYLVPLLKAGYELRVREPGHRMLRTPALYVHIHLLENDHPNVNAYLMLRNRLRNNLEDRELYARTKRQLMSRGFSDMNAYADAKTGVIEGILSRAQFAPHR
ncbi:GrpB family protein [Arthrobacter sp. TMP15]|uniref:GrpB family protein n=1 Tax=Arthrobacter sp. TMP15 TaxID=3140789 RepID=UPI0031BB0E7F